MAAADAARDGQKLQLAALGAEVPRRLPQGARGRRADRARHGLMDFVLALHSHLPYVLNHGRWPHGSDWLCEAAIDTYLPLFEALRSLASEGTPAPVTIGFTPVLANQLVSPTFAAELEAYFQQRITACGEAADTIRGTNDE